MFFLHSCIRHRPSLLYSPVASCEGYPAFSFPLSFDASFRVHAPRVHLLPPSSAFQLYRDFARATTMPHRSSSSASSAKDSVLNSPYSPGSRRPSGQPRTSRMQYSACGACRMRRLVDLRLSSCIAPLITTSCAGCGVILKISPITDLVHLSAEIAQREVSVACMSSSLQVRPLSDADGYPSDEFADVKVCRRTQALYLLC